MKLDPDSDSLPKRSELPDIPGAPKGVAWVWEEDDEACCHCETGIGALTDFCMI